MADERELSVTLDVTVTGDADDTEVADLVFEAAHEHGLGDSVLSINNSYPS